MKKPIVLVIMDGVGRGDGGPGDAVKQANTPTLDNLMATCPMTWLKAHGTAVGLPTDDDMGNSEVGHNALGCGQIYSQGAKLVQESIESGSLYQSKTWIDLTDNCLQNGKALHFIGLLSDGNVHSNISHLIAMLKKAREMGLKKVYCHILLDGRDVPATSALDYVDQLESVLAELNDAEHEYKIASGGGRMVITMDRYEANWPMVEKGWRTHVQAEGRQFASAREAIETYRAENPGMIDQDLLPFVVAHDGKPVAKIENGDSVILFNFRGDRAQEISLAFDRKDFDKFDRGDYTGVKFAGMLEYDGDLKIPMHYLVEPPVIRNTLTEVLCKAGVHEYAVSETQKYGHVTYFWNGNRSGKVDESLEDYAEVPSDVIPFEQAPAMKSVEITDLLVEAMASHKYQFLRCNYPNGDMVGHTGVLSAVITAMEAVDAGLARVKEAADKYGYTLLVTADHRDHISILLRNPQNGTVILDILPEMLLQENIVDQSTFNNGNHCLQLFLDQQLIFPLQTLGIDIFHGLAKSVHDPGLLHGFGDILHNSQLDCFLGIVEFIIGRHHNKHRVIIGPADLFHGIDAVDPRHLDIHDCNVRSEALRQFDDTPSGFGILHFTDILKFFLNNELQGIDHDSFIICQHDLIHLLFLSPLPEDTGSLPCPGSCHHCGSS